MKATPENSFTIDSDGVDPDLVPKKLLDSGAAIPCIGLGTFGSDKISGEVVAETVKRAAAVLNAQLMPAVVIKAGLPLFALPGNGAKSSLSAKAVGSHLIPARISSTIRKQFTVLGSPAFGSWKNWLSGLHAGVFILRFWSPTASRWKKRMKPMP